ncbi:MAG: PAS domain-containing protein [Alphaproteobacteria bacterium]|nr:PAS domain-containing protein [Alphaproteobacteria bacterium]
MNDEPETTSAEASGNPARRAVASCPIVGVGASAGGLAAFTAFFRAMPPAPGMAFVLIQHLDPTRGSHMAELLGRQTRMPVREVDGDIVPEANHVYLIPPNKNLIIERGTLRLLDPVEPRGRRAPIDVFFRSLAEDQGENAACIVLSGTGSDGTLGLRAVKQCGGLTLTQSEGSAQYGGMPQSAAATGLGDYVLPVEAMPATLVNYFRHIGHSCDETGAGELFAEAGDQLAKICAILQTRTGHDFNRYKKNTLTRRIQRRMQVAQAGTAQEYIDILRKSDDEAKHLFSDLLINVTQFFRDKDAFKTLARDVIPRIVDGRGAQRQIRVWVPGCSTGEEAYSLGMLIAERMGETGASARVHIFASDIDEDALDVARVGRYSEAIVGDVGRERLERFFVATDHGYQVTKELREMCIFSPHSVIKDPPFSKLDLISCRNLLIYLGGQLQAKLIPIFHYALKPGGHLFLGPSENVSQNSRLFAPLDVPGRIFLRRDVPTPANHFPLRGPSGLPSEGRTPPRRGLERRATEESMAERLILDTYAPAYALVTELGEIIQVSNRTGKYLELPGGAPSLNIVNMARLGLRNDLRLGLRRAARENRRVVHADLEFDVEGGRQTIDLIVHPLGGAGHFMVVFQDRGAVRAERVTDEAEHAPPDGENGRVRELEADLRLARERLRTTIEELESSNEELKSSNEEMMSMNEELQSANEELESSKEELQSINEELETVNAELRHKVIELSQANGDLQNLFDSTQIATIFLGGDLRIKNFSPAAKRIFHLIDSDKGRPLSDLAIKFPLFGPDGDSSDALSASQPVEREIRLVEDGPDLLMRALPYRTMENVIDGVVLTFVDVTRLKNAERHLAESEARYRAVLHGAHDAALVFAITADGEAGAIQEGNAATRAMLGYDEGETARLRLQDIAAVEPDADRSAWTRDLLAQGSMVRERDYRAKDGAIVPVEESATVIGFGRQTLVLVLARDISERRENQRRQDVLMRELQHRVKNTMATVSAIVSHTGQRATDFPTFKALLEGRMQALAETHAKLTRSNWGPVALRGIAEDALRAYEDVDGCVTIDGDAVTVAPKAALTLAMAFHELAANAAKYGALSVPEGKVRLRWKHQAGRLDLLWEECDGPPVTRDPGRGFGRFLLERGISYDLDGTVDLTFDPAGVRCHVAVPWDQIVGNGEV